MDEQAKKRRRLLSQPDGFLPTKKTQQRVHAPKFQSAFDEPAASTSSSSKKPISLQQFSAPQFKPRPPDKKQPVMVRRQPVPVAPSYADPQSAGPSIPLKHQEPPAVPIMKAGQPHKPTKPLSSARVFITEQPSLAPVPLKPLQSRVPVVPEPPATTESREMKPLSTTHLADISSNKDPVELSSILLQLQDYRTVEPSQDQKHDVLTSPQKGKHVRGGLASRASHLYGKSHTSLYLWRAAIESQPARQSAPDISFRVHKILHTISSGIHKSCLSITLCRVHIPVRPFSSRKQLVYVVVRFPDASKYSNLCDLSDLIEGCTLRIWRPWHEAALVDFSSEPATPPNASLPIPSSSNDSVNISPDNIHNIVLLCSRFTITRDA
ncbi:hypothetical protein P691DRAFT_673357 [Macrolepiota fuliginosa MF-IS2]|uniref:Uncharacterized protein n=1 Tax=Macrolepiota fuliginosa MF-IS2 TaxID=1400762 RepID=A0A9P5XC04_9AGAR|nr:hypothetical protein P691DRAFT_673357 [Macrolepiota fuliginosa MF-IS2]